MPGNRPFKLGHAGNRRFNRLVLASPEPRGRVTKRLAARRYTHVLGHNFAPFAFQKPRLGLLTEQTALYTFSWFSARSRQFGRDKDVTDKNGIGVRVFIRRNAAAYGDEVSAPPEPISYGF